MSDGIAPTSRPKFQRRSGAVREQYFPVGALVDLVGFDAEGTKISLTFTGTQISAVFVSGLGDL